MLALGSILLGAGCARPSAPGFQRQTLQLAVPPWPHADLANLVASHLARPNLLPSPSTDPIRNGGPGARRVQMDPSWGASTPWAEVTRQSEADLRALFAAGAPDQPDVALVDWLGVARWGSRGLLRDVSPTATAAVGLNGALPPEIRELVTRDKRWYGVPVVAQATGWLVRRDSLGRQSLAPPKTYAEFASVAQRVGEAGGISSGLTLPLAPGTVGELLGLHLLLSFGGSVLDETGRRVALNSPATQDALQYVAGLAREPWLWRPVDPNADATQVAADHYARGSIALTAMVPGAYARLVATGASPREVTLVLPLPAGPQRTLAVAHSYHLVVPKSMPDPEAADALIRRLLHPDLFRQLLSASSGEIVPLYAYLTKDAFWNGDPNREALALSTRGDPAHGIPLVQPGYPGPPTREAAEIEARLIVSRMFWRVLRGEAASEVATDAHRECEEIVRRLASSE